MFGKKLTKTFIYNWLKEDLFGELTLYKKTHFARASLAQIWDYISRPKNVRRSNLLKFHSFNKLFIQFASFCTYATLLKDPFFIKSTLFTNDNLDLINNIILCRSQLWKLKNINNNIVLTTKVSFNKLLSTKNSWKGGFNDKLLFRPSKVSIWDKIPYRIRVLQTRRSYKKFVFKRKVNFLPYKLNLLFFIKSKSYIIQQNKKNNFYLRRSLTQLSPDLLIPNIFYNIFWDNFSYIIKTYYLNLEKQVSRPLSSRYQPYQYSPRFNYMGQFTKQKLSVRRSEIQALLNFRILKYFSVVNNPFTLKKIVNWDKSLFNDSLSNLEFRLNNLILRCGFLDNGYLTSSLVKRGVFLVNGIKVINPSLKLHSWDMITVSNPTWWLIYSRLLNFFCNFLSKKSVLMSLTLLDDNQHSNRLFVLKHLLKRKKLFQKNMFVFTKLSNFLPFSKLFNIFNSYYFCLPPSYMEVSYKLLVTVIYKATINPEDFTLPVALSSLRSRLRAAGALFYNPVINMVEPAKI